MFISVSFSIASLIYEKYAENPQMKINSLKKQKHSYLIQTGSDKAFKGRVVNRALPSLHGGSVKVTLTEFL